MRRIALLVGIPVLVAVAYSVFWFVVAGRAEGWIADWAAAEPDKPWHGSFEGVEVSGFPFAMVVRVASPEVVWHDGVQEAIWSGAWLVARYRPWNPNRIDFELPDNQTVDVDTPNWSGLVAIQTSQSFGHIEMADGKARRVTTESRDLVATAEQLAAPVTADRLVVTAEAVPAGDNHDLFVEVENLGFPAQLPAPFTGLVPFAAASLSLNGDVPSGGPVRDRLALWRDAGGTLDVLSLKVDWPPLAIEADGTVALDEAFRPMGAFSSEISGYGELLDALVELGTVSRGEASVAGTVLDVMARRDEATGERRLKVPVTIQNGTLFIGPVPLMPVPPVVAPDVAL
jgi:hypothetical protein